MILFGHAFLCKNLHQLSIICKVKTNFLTWLIKSHYHLPKALCLAIPMGKTFSSNISVCAWSEFALYVLNRYFFCIHVDWAALPTSLCTSHPTHSQGSDSNSPLPGSLPLLPPPVTIIFFSTLRARLWFTPLARYWSYPVVRSYISFVDVTFALLTIL